MALMMVFWWFQASNNSFTNLLASRASLCDSCLDFVMVKAPNRLQIGSRCVQYAYSEKSYKPTQVSLVSQSWSMSTCEEDFVHW